MSKGKKLFKDTLLYGVSDFGSKILVFLLLPLYTHYFTTSEFGYWDLVVTTITLLVPFITLEIVSAVYRWLIVEKDRSKQQEIISTGAFIIFRNLLLLNLPAFLLCYYLSIPFGWEIILYLNSMVLFSFLKQCARGLGFNKLFALLGIYHTFIMVSLILTFIFLFDLRLEALFYASIISNVAVSIIAWLNMNFNQYISRKSYIKELIKPFLVYSIPIIPGAVSWWIMNMSDRYFVIFFLGMEYNGIYAIANKIPGLLLMINTVFSLAWKDSAILEFNSKDKNHYYSTVFRHFFRLMATSVICLTLVSKPVFEIILGDEFTSAWKYIGILLFATLFSALSQFWGAGFHGAKKTSIIFTTSLIGAVVNIIVNLIFIRHLGLYAVAFSTLIAFIVMWLIRVFSTKGLFEISIRLKDLFILFPLILLSIIIPFMTDGFTIYIFIGTSFLLFIWFNLELFRQMDFKGRITRLFK